MTLADLAKLSERFETQWTAGLYSGMDKQEAWKIYLKLSLEAMNAK